MLAVILACIIGARSMRKPLTDHKLLYAVGLAIALRFIFESALEGYYIWPALAIFVLAAASAPLARFVTTGVAAIGVTTATCYHFGPWWLWWSVAISGLGIVAGCSFPNWRVNSGLEERTDLNAIESSFEDRVTAARVRAAVLEAVH
jgi:hypothetical protein